MRIMTANHTIIKPAPKVFILFLIFHVQEDKYAEIMQHCRRTIIIITNGFGAVIAPMKKPWKMDSILTLHCLNYFFHRFLGYNLDLEYWLLSSTDS